MTQKPKSAPGFAAWPLHNLVNVNSLNPSLVAAAGPFDWFEWAGEKYLRTEDPAND